MKKRFLAALIVGLVLMLSLSACGAVSDMTTVGDAGKAFMAAMEKQDATAAWNMMVPELQTDIGTFESWNEYVNTFQFTESKFNSTSIENGTGYLEGTAKVDADTYNISLVLDKVDEVWMLSGINFELQ
jgi:hypothetical protein